MNARRLLAALPAWFALGGGALGVPTLRDTHILSYPLLSARVSAQPEGTLLFSDSPETPSRPGVLYRDTVTGRFRVLAYHVNGTGQAARLVVVVRNAPGQAAALTLLRRGSSARAQPDPLVGQQTLLRYFASAPGAARTLAPGESAVLYSSAPLAPGQVISLMLDAEVTSGSEISVLLLAAGDVPLGEAARRLPALARDGVHQRGTFPGIVRALQVELSGLPARLVLGGGGDPPLSGTDALSGEPQVLRGNYGLLYDIEVQGRPGVLLTASPRGGSYQGVLWLRDGPHASLVLIGRTGALVDPAAPAPLWRVRSGQLRLSVVPGNGFSLPLALVFYAPPALRGR